MEIEKEGKPLVKLLCVEETVGSPADGETKEETD